MEFYIKKSFIHLAHGCVTQHVLDEKTAPKTSPASCLEENDYISLSSFLSIIDSLPGMIYWKSTKGILLGCNNVTANLAGLKTKAEFVGKTDFDLCWQKYAKTFRENDEKAMDVNNSILIYENSQIITGDIFSLQAVKSPIWDRKGNIAGVIGNSLNLSELKKFRNFLVENDKKNQFFQLPTIDNMRYFLENETNKYIIKKLENKYIYLTEREMQCLYYLFLGYTSKETAKALKISFRTVETYLNNAKVKIGYKNRSEMVRIFLENIYL